MNKNNLPTIDIEKTKNIDVSCNDQKYVSHGFMFSLISILIVVNILVRYPITAHEIGWDSYIIHSLAGAISNSGNATWILYPTSYFGMYPMSEPSGVPFLISAFSQLSGLSIEGAIWAYNVILGLLAALGAYMLAGHFKNIFWFKYSVAFLFSTSMGLLLFTTWTLSTRGTLVVLTPLFFFIFIKALEKFEPQYVITGALLMFGMASSHRMFVLIFPFIILYLITQKVIVIKRMIKTHNQTSKHKKFRILSAFIFITSIIVLFLLPLFGGFEEVYSTFLRLNQYKEMLVWGVGVFARNLGMIGFLSLLGLILLLMKRAKDKYEIFILGCIAIISPLMMIGKYISTYSIIFFMLLAAYGLLLLYKNMAKKVKWFYTLTSMILVTSFVMSGYGQISTFNILSEGNSVDARYLEIQGYDAAMWMKQNDVETIIGSSQLTLRSSAVSGVSYFPGQGPTQLIYGFAHPEDMHIERQSIFDIGFYTNSPLVDSEMISQRITWCNYDINRRVVTDNIAQEYIRRYNIETLILNNQESHTIFAISVTQTSYCIFQNQKASIYFINAY